jgi:fructan beta-fructosidase
MMKLSGERTGLFLLIFWVSLVMYSCSSGEDDDPIDEHKNLEVRSTRPFYHLTPPTGWMNDPNGMVFLKGEYHIFYQHNPDDIVWGPMHWRHAISSDLFHWKDQGIKIEPDEIGTIFSGSAVVDWQNTSGFQTGDEEVLVAMFTHAGNLQVQSLAYSNDRGRTWEKYDNNPVLSKVGDFRDPKVFFYSPEQKWIQVIAAGDRIQIYSSLNMVDWVFESDFGPGIGYTNGVWECPDLFPLKSEDGTEKWIMIVSVGGTSEYSGVNGGSATQYFVGDFDGNKFTHENDEILWADYGIDNYAGITWSDIPNEDGRRIFIGWMNNWHYAGLIPATEWRGAMTVPRQLGLKKNSENKYFLTFEPVDELLELTGKNEVYNETVQEVSIEDNEIIQSGSFKIKTQINLSNNSFFELKVYNSREEVLLKYDKNQAVFSIDRSSSGNTNVHNLFVKTIKCDYAIKDNILPLEILLDQSSIEVFINNGEKVMTALIFPRYEFNDLKITGSGGSELIQGLELVSIENTIDN